MHSKVKFEFDGDGNLTVEPPKQPKRKHDFSVSKCKIWISEGVIYDSSLDEEISNRVEHLTICPVTGLLMFLDTDGWGEGQNWSYLQDNFQSAYKKWAKKQAEKALLGDGV